MARVVDTEAGRRSVPTQQDSSRPKDVRGGGAQPVTGAALDQGPVVIRLTPEGSVQWCTCMGCKVVR